MRFTSFFRTASKLAAAALVTAALSVSAWAGSFSDAKVFSPKQEKAIGELVKKYLLTNPEILRDAFQELERRENEAKEKLAQKGIVDNAKTLYRSELSYVAGNAEGDISMVEFFDYNCGFCKRAFGDVLAILKSDKNLRLVVKEFPILGPGSVFASRAAIAAKEQGKYWDLHVALMEARGSLDEGRVMSIAKKIGLDVDKLRADMGSPRVTAEIEETYALANKLGVNGTPAFIIDDKLIPGAMGLQALEQQVATVRQSGGCKIC